MEQLIQKNKAKLKQYSELVHEYNQKKNITGFQSVDEIYNQLVCTSLIDLEQYNVPRGTYIADLGSGNGVPGIVLAIAFPQFRYLLVDSNEKKCAFLNLAVEELGLEAVEIRNNRAETVSRENREKCGIVVSRAFGPIMYSLEFGLSMLKMQGHLFIYSHKRYDDLSSGLNEFSKVLGAEKDSIHAEKGIALVKVNETPLKYPRNFPVIKRDAARMLEFKD